MLMVCLASLLVPGVSGASDRVLLQREYYYNTNPEIRRVVGEIDERSHRELTEPDREVKERLDRELKGSAAAYLETQHRDEAGGSKSDAGPSSTENWKRLEEAVARHEKVELDTTTEIFGVLERTTPYLVLECVVAPGEIETARAALREGPVSFQVGLSRFEDGTPWLFVSQKHDDGRFIDSTTGKIPRPVPLNVPTIAERLGFGSKDPVDAVFQRARLAPEYRPNGCTVTRPGGEAPPPIPPRPPRNQPQPYYPVPASQKSW
jgi:hypothetical protein